MTLSIAVVLKCIALHCLVIEFDSRLIYCQRRQQCVTIAGFFIAFIFTTQGSQVTQEAHRKLV
jgi:hypothetical protein